MARPTPRYLTQRKLLCVAIAACFPIAGGANPLDPTVVSGSAIFNATGNTLRIENSPGAIINWGSFSIGANELTHFQQQSAASQVLNRVTGGDPSQILGTLTSNGQVFLINPNGIAFGAGATVDVAGLVASTLNISNADFLAGRLSFAAQNGAAGIRNDGTLQAASGGRIYLVAPTIENTGVIAASDGSVVLAAGHSLTLIDSSRPDVQVQLTASADEAVNVGRIVGGHVGIYAATIRQGGSLSASTAVAGANGSVILKAATTITDAGSSISASGAGGGTVEISADLFWHAGAINTDGGIIRVAAGSVFQSGAMRADGTIGGEITLLSSGNVLQTESSILSANGTVRGGDVRVGAGAGQLYSSGRFEAMSSTGRGGSITLIGDRIALVAASADASGAAGGGAIRVGGDFHGAGAGAANAQAVYLSGDASLRSDATVRGDGGTVVAWSDGSMQFAGAISIRGGAGGGNGGSAEVSGAIALRYAGTTDASAARGVTGTLLLDPKNIIIDDSAPAGSSGYVIGDFVDPNPTAGGRFGSWQETSQLSGGNLLVRVPDATVGGFTNAGAAYLFNGTTRALIAALTGSKASEHVGSDLVQLNNGSYIIHSPDWDGSRGALTFGTPGTLASGVVGSANSLVGSTPGDSIGSGGIRQLGGTRIAIGSPNWDNAEANAVNAGAFTILDAASGLSGAVSTTNSLVGSQIGDRVGNAVFSTLTQVNFGKYVLTTPAWNGARGAATFVDPASPAVGIVSSANSLVGATAGDGNSMSIQTLAGDAYAVIWPSWTNTVRNAVGAGAITFNFSNTGISGVVGAANSLIGNAPGSMDQASIDPLFGGATDNYLVANPGWSNVSASQTSNGAVTFVPRASGISGEVTAANSLVGGSSNQRIGDDVRVRGNGSYLVVAPGWDDEINNHPDAGAVSFGASGTGVVGVVSHVNSFVGLFPDDQIGSGGIHDVGNDDYVIASPFFNSNRGAVTWANGNTGVTGAPDTVPTLRGSTPGDFVGTDITVLSNGHYVVHSPDWNLDTGNLVIANVGAMTWVNGFTGVIAGTSSGAGFVSLLNSLTGNVSGSRVGSGGVVELSNGNYLVLSPQWTDIGSSPEKGAVTYALGDSGSIPQFGGPDQPIDLVPAAVVDATNSLVGKFAFDRVSAEIDNELSVNPLSGGGIVVRSPQWNGSRGAVTWMSLGGNVAGQLGFGGIVDTTNSFVGTTTGDQVGEEFRDLFNGRYLIGSPNWGDVGRDVSAAGALTLFRSATGERVADNATFGTLSSANSLVGNADNDQVGRLQSDLQQVFLNSGTRYLLESSRFDGGNGALTWLGDGTTAVTGIVGATNSLVGAGVSGNLNTVGDTIVVSSSNWNGGRGAVTFLSSNGEIFGTGGSRGGTIGPSNSLVGSSPGDFISYRGTLFAYPSETIVVVGSTSWNGNRGAIGYFADTGAAGVIGSDNSLVGAAPNDRVGSGGFTSFGAFGEQRVILSPDWNGARGTMTYFTTGTLDAAFATAHGVVGTNANDRVGSSGIQQVGINSAAVLLSPNWNNNAGAVTYLGDGTGQVTGAVSAANSIVGNAPSQRVGNGGVLNLGDDAFLVLSPSWTDNASPNLGAITYVDATTGRPFDGNGVVSRANSLVGPVANARYGTRFSESGTDVRSRFSGNTFLLFAPDVPSASSPVQGGRLMLVDVATTNGAAVDELSFGDQPDGDVTVRGSAIAAALASANLVLEASNDITLVAGTNITVAGANGHALTLRAGRNVFLDGNITTANGDLTVIANEQVHTGSADTGVIAGNRDPGRGDIVMAAATFINAGSGDVRLEIHDGRLDASGSDFNTGGDITAGDIRAATIAILNRSRPDPSVGSVFLNPVTAITTTGTAGLISILASGTIQADGPVRAPNGRIELRARSSLMVGDGFPAGEMAFDAEDILIAPDSDANISLLVGGVDPNSSGVLYAGQGFVDRLKVSGTLQLGDAATDGVQLGRRAGSDPGSLRFGPGAGGGEAITGIVKVTGAAVSDSNTRIGGVVSSRAAGLTFERPVTIDGDISLGGSTVLFQQDADVTGSRTISSTASASAITFLRRLRAETGGGLSLFGPTTVNALVVEGGDVVVNDTMTASTVGLSSGTIQVAGMLQVADFTQSGGTLLAGGLANRGDLLVTRSYNVTQGNLGQNWNSIAITHRTGNLTLNRLMDVGTALAINATAGRLRVSSDLISEGTIALAASGGIAIESDVTAERNLAISTPRDLTVSFARVNSSFGNINLNVGSLDVLAFQSGESGVTEIVARRGNLVANVAGNVRLVGGEQSGSEARIGSRSGECTMNVGGDLILTGGDGFGSDAVLFGNPDVGSVARPLTVGGQILMTTSAAGEGGVARIEAFEPDTIHIRFPTRSSGGYLVNGKEVVADGGSGFFANNQVAVLDTNLLISYGGGGLLFDPTPTLSPLVTAGERGSQFAFTRERRAEEDFINLPSCR